MVALSVVVGAFTDKSKVNETPIVRSHGSCSPNYSPCVPIDSDVDCANGDGNGPSYVQGPVKVIGSDVYDLDRDGNGIGCD